MQMPEEYVKGQIGSRCSIRRELRWPSVAGSRDPCSGLLATVAVGLAGRTRYLYGPPVAIVKEAGDPIDGSSLLLEVAWKAAK